MGFFSFFSKEKKETLDKGLSKTKESVFGKIARAVAGKSKVDDEVLDNLEDRAGLLYHSTVFCGKGSLWICDRCAACII